MKLVASTIPGHRPPAALCCLGTRSAQPITSVKPPARPAVPWPDRTSKIDTLAHVSPFRAAVSGIGDPLDRAIDGSEQGLDRLGARRRSRSSRSRRSKPAAASRASPELSWLLVRCAALDCSVCCSRMTAISSRSSIGPSFSMT